MSFLKSPFKYKTRSKGKISKSEYCFKCKPEKHQFCTCNDNEQQNLTETNASSTESLSEMATGTDFQQFHLQLEQAEAAMAQDEQDDLLADLDHEEFSNSTKLPPSEEVLDVQIQTETQKLNEQLENLALEKRRVKDLVYTEKRRAAREIEEAQQIAKDEKEKLEKYLMEIREDAEIQKQKLHETIQMQKEQEENKFREMQDLHMNKLQE